MKSICLLGATGSIGQSTLSVVDRHPERFRINALSAHSQVDALLVNLRDVTLQIEAQEALARSEERFRALAQHSSDSVFLTTADGIITYASPAVEHVFGHPPEALPRARLRLHGHPSPSAHRSSP